MQRASLAALRHNGCEVVTPRDQTCCGALHFHTGLRARGLELLAQNVRAFAAADFDAVIVDAAGCGSTSRNTRTWPPYAGARRRGRIRAAGARYPGISRPARLVPPRHEVRVRVAYDEPCHLLHGQRVSAAPRAILRPFPGSRWVPLQDADRCCGSAGVYNVAQPELASAIREEKIRNIAASGAEVVATGIRAASCRSGPDCSTPPQREPRLAAIRVVHPMQLLATSYGEPSDLGA
jgi:glycolate oxidase iron-sulfur subunit